MPFAAGERAIKDSMVRLFDSNLKTRGCGLLVDAHHIVTCAHVVALAASGVKPAQVTVPSDRIHVRLWTDDYSEKYATVLVWTLGNKRIQTSRRYSCSGT
jgi:hypothetical protein